MQTQGEYALEVGNCNTNKCLNSLSAICSTIRRRWSESVISPEALELCVARADTWRACLKKATVGGADWCVAQRLQPLVYAAHAGAAAASEYESGDLHVVLRVLQSVGFSLAQTPCRARQTEWLKCSGSLGCLQTVRYPNH